MENRADRNKNRSHKNNWGQATGKRKAPKDTTDKDEGARSGEETRTNVPGCPACVLVSKSDGCGEKVVLPYVSTRAGTRPAILSQSLTASASYWDRYIASAARLTFLVTGSGEMGGATMDVCAAGGGGGGQGGMVHHGPDARFDCFWV